jgi:hypothetical protein
VSIASMGARLNGQAGVALLTALMSMMLMAALGSALILTTMTEAGVAGHYAAGVEAFYAADGAVNRTLAELPDIADWSSITGTRFDGAAETLLSAAPANSQLRIVVTIAAAEAGGGLVVRAQVSGTRDVQKTVEATVVRTAEPGPANVRLLAWREIR